LIVVWDSHSYKLVSLFLSSTASIWYLFQNTSRTIE
jgi:hypothetical protein